MMLKILLIISTILISYVHLDESIFCSAEFCAEHIKKEKCREVPAACSTVVNETSNGIYLPFPGPCNCCDYCLETLGQNDTCALGDPASAVPSEICGGGLSCQNSAGNSTCQEMYTQCFNAQKTYDKSRLEGTLGNLQVRPECEDDGTYKPYKIIPGEIVYCVSEDGKRIFGEVPEATFNKTEFNCKCSRNYEKMKERLYENLHQVEHFRCKSNGDYDPLQCIGSFCLCAKEIDGTPTNDSQLMVQMDDISNKTLECFDHEIHKEFEYYRECELNYRREFAIIKEHILDGFEILEMNLPNCQLDGYYAAVQENETAKFCVDPHGEILEDFVLNDKDKILSETMDCNCARARSIIMDNEKPDCCKNGNYKKLQCRRGKCRCVDNNGYQLVMEVDYEDRDLLPCTSSACAINNPVKL